MPFPRQRLRLRTAETIPREATNVLITDAGAALVVPPAIIAMTSAPAAKSFCRSVPSIVVKLARPCNVGVVQPAWVTCRSAQVLSTRVAGCRAARERGRGGHGTT